MLRAPSAEKEWIKDRLEVRQYATRDEMGRAAAEEAAAALRNKLAMQDHVRMVLAAAPSQSEFLHYLGEAEGVDWKRVTAFHMDEYIGLGPDAPQCFGIFLGTRFFMRVNLGKVHLIDSLADPGMECERYASLLQEAPIDMVCLGIGENGHLAFNDPPVADFQDPYTVKTVRLDDMCRQQQVHDGCFARLEDVPEYALTMTIPALLSAERLFCIVPGAAKRNAVLETLEGPLSPSCPASILRTHPDCRLYLDRDSSPGR
ncbi:glucosamine-6-phosphate deaminase [Paenibacillus sp.]|jgi:glucosamine-6-phosphate deaminase|uniref:glucosamine-6-phosphate deaminase n=1 Tax=Paenibacillus sp. TaxID=58172 RepID=UPI0028398B7B|nr:glucosamine-6-phosphate deaminase [Paenibacillus sp.]MDR0271606.1 glucosamine-6-phosphate deaminase [Paenibacillus sp.]